MINEIEVADLNTQLIENSSIKVIDVRSHQEIAQGTIPGAEPLPLHLLPMNEDRIPTDQPVVFMCRSGGRSAQACYYLSQKGFSNVLNLRGGIIAWAQQGFEFEAPANA